MKLLKIIKEYKNNKAGFTLMEALVSITIMTVIFGAPIALSFKMNSQFDYISKKMIANNLAQEGVEIINAFRANAAITCLRNGDCDPSNMSPFWTDTNNGFVNKMITRCAGTPCAVDLEGLSKSIANDGSIDYNQFIAASNCVSLYSHTVGPYTCASQSGMIGESSSGFARYITVARYNDIFTNPMSANTELLVTSGVKFYSGGEQKIVEIKSVLKTFN